MKIMVFLHGTTIMHKNAQGVPREERVRQVVAGDESLHDYASYVPVDNAVQKLQAWKKQGIEIVYLSSHQTSQAVEVDQAVLQKHGFPGGRVYFRQGGESYAQVAESVLPDILIEDDCESIGGETEMAYPHIQPEFKTEIKSLIIKEFGGIDHLPDDIDALMNY